ncbi:MAG: helix-turn-helix domain-containing protein [Nocardioidaceae bacterium]
MQLWDPVLPPSPGHLVAVVGPVPDESEVLRVCASVGAAAVLRRDDGASSEHTALTGLAAELGLVLLRLAGGHPWWPALRQLEAALGSTDPGPSGLRRAGEDLFALADEMAAAVGGPVILEDASFRVLAYSAYVGRMDRGRSEAILGRRIPEPWLEHLAATGSLQTIRSSPAVVDLVDGPWQARRRLITAVRAGNRLVGVVWAAEGDAPLPEGARGALRRAADDAAPLLVRHLERAEADADRRARHLRAVLDGRPITPSAATELGLEPAGTYAVVAVAGPDSPAVATSHTTEERANRLVEHVVLCCESFRHPASVIGFGPGALAVVTVTAGSTEESTARLGQEVVRLAGSGPLFPLRSAVSGHGAGLPSVPRLRDEAMGALAVLEDADTPRSVRFLDVEAEVLVRGLVAALPPGTTLSGLERLAAHDSAHAGDLVGTLKAYLEACGSASAAAASLGIHVTTLRHRLHRVADISALRLDDPAVRVACDLLLRRGRRDQ